jgi:F-type H+-transporting ATPase subunit epsilon
MAMGPHVSSELDVMERQTHPGGTAATRLSLSVVTPRGSVLGHDADEIIAPGSEGEFGVLPGHVPFLSALKPGVVTVREGPKREILAVASGYLQVGVAGKVQVLVEQALAPSEIDAEAARAEKARVEELLRAQAQAPATGAEAPPTGSQTALEARLAWANAQLAALDAARSSRP